MSHKKKIPYEDTEVPWVRTKYQIEGLLAEYGAIGIQWTTYRGEENLKFIIDVELHGVRKEIGFEVRPPRIPRERGRKPKHKDQEYRLLWWWLKSKLEAVRFGLSSMEREFLAQVMVSLPDGSTTVGEILEDYIERDQLEALPGPPRERKRIDISQEAS